MENSVNQRLKIVFEYLNVSQHDIADAIGTSRQTISSTLLGKTTPKTDLIERILNVYPTINPEWLMTGKGNMTRNEGEIISDSPKEESRSSQVSEEWRATIEKMETFYKQELEYFKRALSEANEQNKLLTMTIQEMGKP